VVAAHGRGGVAESVDESQVLSVGFELVDAHAAGVQGGAQPPAERGRRLVQGPGAGQRGGDGLQVAFAQGDPVGLDGHREATAQFGRQVDLLGADLQRSGAGGEGERPEQPAAEHEGDDHTAAGAGRGSSGWLGAVGVVGLQQGLVDLLDHEGAARAVPVGQLGRDAVRGQSQDAVDDVGLLGPRRRGRHQSPVGPQEGDDDETVQQRGGGLGELPQAHDPLARSRSAPGRPRPAGRRGSPSSAAR
jgi:hypothetical protein